MLSATLRERLEADRPELQVMMIGLDHKAAALGADRKGEEADAGSESYQQHPANSSPFEGWRQMELDDGGSPMRPLGAGDVPQPMSVSRPSPGAASELAAVPSWEGFMSFLSAHASDVGMASVKKAARPT